MSTFDEACLQDEIAALRLTAWRAEDERDAARAVLMEAVEVLNIQRADHPGWWAAWVERARTAAKGGER